MRARVPPVSASYEELIDASAEEIFDAWTTSDDLKGWFGPGGFQTIEAAGSWLLLDSAAGMFRSRDGGRRWTAFAPPSAPGASPYGPRICRGTCLS